MKCGSNHDGHRLGCHVAFHGIISERSISEVTPFSAALVSACAGGIL